MIDVALRRRLASEGVGLVGQADVQGAPIEVGVHGDRRDARAPWHARMTRTAISPRLAIRIFCSTFANVGGVSGAEHLPGTPWLDVVDGGWPTGWSVRHIAETGSTNADLADVADTAPDRTVLATGHQTAGRGRLDRRWDAPPGSNLLVSMLFRAVPHDPGELTRRVALAAATAATEVTGAPAELKWPNDLLIGDAKLAGILAQRATNGAVVVGIGLNVGWAPEGAAKLDDHGDARGGAVAVPEVLAAMLRAIDALPDDIGALYRQRLGTLGKRVRVELPDGEVVGTATDVDEIGRLLVLDECAITHRIDVGDVVHLRPA